MDIISLIEKKKNNEVFTGEEIKYIINNYLNGNIEDYQMSSLLMAICLKGMNEEETIKLTEAMLNSGDKLDLSKIKGIKVDKHSTGGVGDKTTLIVGPLVASCGVIVPKMSGRGLGHTGGTIDKLESIKGFKTNLSTNEFFEQLEEIGLVVATSTLNIDPADKKIYALRDVTGTVDSIPLIASSIMSKKLASGADKIVLDVKVGKGAFLERYDEALELSKIMINIGKAFNKETVVVISNMDYPLGNNIGNALEVLEAIDILKGNGNERLRELCLNLATQMVSLGRNISFEEAENMVVQNLLNGQAYHKFLELVEHQHGEVDDILISENIIPIVSNQEGYINEINALKIGVAAMNLGAGRKTKDDIINHKVGIVLTKLVGDYVKQGDVIANVYQGDIKVNPDEIINAYIIEDQKKEEEPLIYNVIK